MHISKFIDLNLMPGDYILIINEKGERFGGTYLGQYNSLNHTFKFQNNSNGQTETIEVHNLQMLTKD